jgi:hypothetical protein
MRRGGGGRLIRVALPAIGAALIALVLAQVLLPGIAASTIRSRVGRYGGVSSVSVSAWPAVELLWGSADSVTVSASDLRLTPAQAAGLIAQADGVTRLQATITSVHIGPLLLQRARLGKRGAELTGEGELSAAAAAAALPVGVRVFPLASRSGRVTVRVSGGLFGFGGAVEAVAEARNGQLVAYPLGRSLQGLRLTLFADPRIAVEGVAVGVASEQPLVYQLRMRARLR